MTKQLMTLAAAALSVAALAAPALADDATNTKRAKHVDDVMARLDTNKDGKISKDEASKGPRLSKHFDDVDADHDGFVTRAELTTAMAHHAKAKQPSGSNG
jgi:Ca2+-binding EF-hand superfamily protein